MDQLLSTALPIALAIIMFSLGIGLTLADFARILKTPKAIFLGIFCQLFILPLIGFILVKIVNPDPAIAFGIMILVLCPGGVMSNIISKLAGGTVALSISLTAIVSLLSIITLPLLVAYFATYFMGEERLTVQAGALGLAMFMITALPVSLGLALRHFKPNLARKAEPIIVRIANTLFALIVIASIATNWDLFVENFMTLGPMMIVLNIILFTLGMMLALLMRLPEKDRIAISIETGIQNSALGITIGTLIVEKGAGLPPFSLPSGVYSITSYLVIFPVILWWRSKARRQG